MNRRSFIAQAAATSVAMVTGPNQRASSALASSEAASPDEGDLKARWQKLDNEIRKWWDGDLARADEEAIIADAEPPKPGDKWKYSTPKSLLFLPFPYTTGGGSVASFPEIYGWDTAFSNLALLEHDRADIVRWNILDQLSMIQRFGKVLNGNRTFYKTRGQTPLLGWSVENYLKIRKDDDEIAMTAYPLLEREYVEYWNGPAHSTPVGLSTCRDGGKDTDDTSLELASEAEALDYTPIFGGEIRNCVPILTNTALVRQANTLNALAERFGWKEKAARWKKEADDRAERINKYCWGEAEGFYFEYDYVKKTRLPYYSLDGFWPLWAGIASKSQAKRVVDHLPLFDRPYGLTFTDKDYPGIHPQFKALEWAYPEAWPPIQIIVGQALARYGYEDLERSISRKYIANVVTTWEKTGQIWERYNGVTGSHDVPVERDPPQPLHGFSSASAVVVGRMAFN